MTIYVDALVDFGWQLRGRRVASCHMFTDDPDLRELHALAQRIGLKRAWFQDKSIPHYDLTAARRRDAIALGAIEVDRRKAVELWRRIRAGA